MCLIVRGGGNLLVSAPPTLLQSWVSTLKDEATRPALPPGDKESACRDTGALSKWQNPRENGCWIIKDAFCVYSAAMEGFLWA